MILRWGHINLEHCYAMSISRLYMNHLPILCRNAAGGNLVEIEIAIGIGIEIEIVLGHHKLAPCHLTFGQVVSVYEK